MRVRAFHMAVPKNLPNLINIQGQKKSISSSTMVGKRDAEVLCGPVRCGAGVYLEGTVMFNSWRDLASAPDQEGRRWIDLTKVDNDFNTKYWFNVAYSDELTNIRDAIEIYIQKGASGIAYRKKLEALYIKRYIDLSEKFISEPQRAKEIEKISITPKTGRGQFFTNNEIILNQIEVIDVIINGIHITPQLETIIPKIKANIKGELIISSPDDTSGRLEFFTKRKAQII